MSDEAALLAAIAANPDDDLARLVYADWLDENRPPVTPSRKKQKRMAGYAPATQNPRAEFIRAQIELARRGDNDTSDETRALRERADELLRAYGDRWLSYFRCVVPCAGKLRVEFRRGFPDHVRAPARWFVDYGEEIRDALPTLTGASIYRLNGWGAKLAQSPNLYDLRELRVPCWSSEADGVALANSPHLGALERLTVWVSRTPEEMIGVSYALGRSHAWPRLQRLTLVWDTDNWCAQYANREAGRSFACGVNPRARTFPLAADFHPAYFVGRTQNGNSVLAAYPRSGETFISVLDFSPYGYAVHRRVPVPADRVLKPKRHHGDRFALEARQARAFLKFHDLIREKFGAEPADIRIREFNPHDDRVPFRVRCMPGEVEEVLWAHDDRNENPYSAPAGALGIGGTVEPWLGDNGRFIFLESAIGPAHVIDGNGRIVRD